MPQPLATSISEELIETAILDHIRSVVSDGYNRIELLNAYIAEIEEGDGGHLFATVSAAKETV